MKLANFTLHDQQEHVFMWKKLGFEIDPKPRAPFIDFETEDWTEEAILEVVTNELEQISSEGFDAILVGVQNSYTIYAWMLGSKFQLAVVMPKLSLEKPSSSGVMLTGYSLLPRPHQVYNYPWLRSLE